MLARDADDVTREITSEHFLRVLVRCGFTTYSVVLRAEITWISVSYSRFSLKGAYIISICDVNSSSFPSGITINLRYKF